MTSTGPTGVTIGGGQRTPADRRQRRRVAVAVAACVGVIAALPAWADRTADEPVVRAIAFPVAGKTSYHDDFGDCRDNCTRVLLGNDLTAPEDTPVVAAVDGRVDWIASDPTDTTNCGNGLTIVDKRGWRYLYCHLGDGPDAPKDPAKPRAERAATPFATGIKLGATVAKGRLLGWVGRSGNVSALGAQLYFEIRTPARVPVNPFPSLLAAQGGTLPAGQCTASTNPRRATGKRASAPRRTTATPTGALGALDGRTDVQVAVTPSGNGEWVATAKGEVFAYGKAAFYGSPAKQGLAVTVIGIAAHPSGKGYWLLDDQGAVHAYGAADPEGDLAGGAHGDGDRPVGLAASGSGGGYWVLSANGAVHPFGEAADLGDLTREGRCTVPTATAIAASPTGRGYVVVASDGSVWAYGDAMRPEGVSRASAPPAPGVARQSAADLLAASVTAGADPKVVRALAYALEQVGKPYVFGAHGPDSFDCSGLIERSYRSVGVKLGWTTATQVHDGKAVDSVAEALPGDLIFVRPNAESTDPPGHVGLYLGNGLVVNAPKTGDVVKIVKLSSWVNRIAAIRRVVPAG